FVRNALGRFGVAEALGFFEGLGLPCVLEGKGCYYPRSGAAADVVELLLEEFRELGGRLVTNARVTELKPGKPASEPWQVRSAEKSWEAEAVILSVGGRSAPKTGSAGDGFELAARLGHSVLPTSPAIVSLELAGNLGHFLQGVKLPAGVNVPELGLTLGADELMFTHYGLSGPLILDLSVEVAGRLAEKPLELELDLLPEVEESALEALLQQRAEAHPKRELGNLLLGMLPRKVLPALLRQRGIDSSLACSAMDGGLRQRIARLLKAFTVSCTATRGWDAAAATLGGVSTKEVNPISLESRLRSGLYLTGELLDICGECGGYNLQWAWSSGYVAGENAASLKLATRCVASQS
ncbi:aminoacetone oxidase family FAD-binding enzyme, partial [bacterium]|nr:aminoacetone oxidase family FAD-binding enzyme [bacterium]